MKITYDNNNSNSSKNNNKTLPLGSTRPMHFQRPENIDPSAEAHNII